MLPTTLGYNNGWESKGIATLGSPLVLLENTGKNKATYGV
jgi:hypothetical protein